MARRGEAEELVRLWQELQQAQVAGDADRLEWLRRRAEAEGKGEDASDEWASLAEEAGRYADRLHEERGEQPSAGIGDDAVPVDVESAPEPVEGGGRRRGRKGSLIWLAFLLGWVVLQIVQASATGRPRLAR
jgi:hypothetical protein